ncbi:MAG: glycosyltransferase, partial [Planctomycetota bacterium]
MRIFYFITEFDIGGAERSLWELARRMKRRGHELAACAASGRGAVGGWMLADGIEVFHLDARGKGDARAFLKLAAILRAWKPEVFHSFLFHANLVGRLAAAVARVPVRLSSARVAERRYRSHVVLDRLTIGLVQAELVVSAGVARFLA